MRHTSTQLPLVSGVLQRARRVLVLTAVAAAAAAASPAAFAQPSPLSDEAAPIVPGRILVMPRAGMPEQALSRLLRQNGAGRARAVGQSGLRIVELKPGSERAMLAKLANNPHFKFVELDRRVPESASSNDPMLGSQWHLSRIDAVSAWSGSQGNGVTIAVLDSGIDTAHPEFAGRLVPGYNFVNGNTQIEDVRNHGTRVAGTAAATLNNGVGVASVAGATLIMPVRISDSTGYATFSAMAQGLTWAADRGARVANISFSGAASSASVLNAANYFRGKGGLVFVSAGNTGGDQGFAPNDAMIVVSATTSGDGRPSWSSFGSYVDLSAPGASIYTTDWNQSYASVNGTSYAAPVAAGVAALVMAANPGLSAEQVQNILYTTAVDLGAAGKDIYYGHGRVDAAAAVAAALAVPAAPAPDTQAPTVQIHAPLGSSTVSGLTAVDVAATDNVGVAKVELRVNGQVLATETTAPFGFSWDTTGLANGMHTLEARAFDAAGNVGSSGSVAVNVANTVAIDVTPPTVAIANPKHNSTVPAGRVDILVNASDDQGPAGLTQTLFIDGRQVATGSGATLTHRWNTRPIRVGSVISLRAVARDAAGNETATTISVRR